MTYKINDRGFTLLEMLMTIAIFGIVITVMYTVFLSTKKTTVNQGELVDVQQTLRVASDFISRDIKMAEVLISAGNTGIAAGSNATSLHLSTASSLYAYAQISADLEIPASTVEATDFNFSISVPTTVDYFAAGYAARIIRPQNGSQPFDVDLNVSGVNRTGPTITIQGFTNANAVQYKAGDIIARVGTGAPDPSTIVWNQNGTDLERNRDGLGANVMAENIGLAFSYLLDNGSETTTPSTAELDNIRAVRVTLTVNTAQQLDGQTRPRSLSSITYLRN